ncbi:hypothetical protein [Corynebacterium sp. HMSC11E11]|uniref:hypothetical protein n=1 Tax=Corynebacterium sp. HMSC11E11 TaxID=1581089 RepID=UPI0008A18B82|nr:hypothetical protein [Corynebacterium sp. HMSC11E11]OFU52142.1 hypothetical protein HMPREF3121_11720 [Corynebacterium sp. HMSC11E11]
MSTEHADQTTGDSGDAGNSVAESPLARETTEAQASPGSPGSPGEPDSPESPESSESSDASSPEAASETEPRITRKTWLLLAAVIVVIQAIGRVWVLAGRTFYWDDFIIVGSAADSDWWTPDYFLQPHDGHLAPLAFILQAAASELAPWKWWLPATLMLLGQVAVTVVTARALRYIAGRSWQALAALALVAWTPLMLPGSTWWSAAANALPMQLALAGITALAVRVSLRQDHPVSARAVVAATVGLIVALGFFEKALAVAPIALAVTISVAYMERRPIGRTLRRGLALWLPLGLVTGAWALFYSLTALGDAGEASSEPRAELFFSGFGQVLAGLAGGPWFWDRWAPGQPWADAPSGLVSVGGVLVLLTMAVIIARDYRAWMPWIIATAYLAVTLLSVTFMRSGDHTSDVLARTLHYYGDSAMVTGFALAASWSDRVNPLPARSRYGVLALAGVLLVSSTISVIGYRKAWADDGTAAWLETASASLEQAAANDDGPVILDQPVPYEVLLPVAYPKNMYSQVFRDVRQRPEFGRVTDEPMMFDDSGELVPARVAEITRIPQGDVESCGTQIVVGPDGTATEEIELRDIAKLGDWVVELRAISSAPAQLRLSLPNPFETEEQTMGGSTVVDVDDDLRTRWVVLSGGGNTLRIDVSGAPEGTSVCVGSGAIGPLVPAHG